MVGQGELDPAGRMKAIRGIAGSVKIFCRRSVIMADVICADGTPEMRQRIERVLTNDPGMGVARHADAGYELAVETARREGLKLPMVDGADSTA